MSDFVWVRAFGSNIVKCFDSIGEAIAEVGNTDAYFGEGFEELKEYFSGLIELGTKAYFVGEEFIENDEEDDEEGFWICLEEVLNGGCVLDFIELA